MSEMKALSLRIAASATVARQGIEGDLDALLFEIGAYHLNALDDGIERGQPLLSVNDGEFGRSLVVFDANALQPGLHSRFPKQKEPRRVPAIERIEEIADIDVGPHKRALQLRQSDLAEVYILDKCDQRIVACGEQRQACPPRSLRYRLRSLGAAHHTRLIAKLSEVDCYVAALSPRPTVLRMWRTGSGARQAASKFLLGHAAASRGHTLVGRMEADVQAQTPKRSKGTHGKSFGYARVSSSEHDLTVQREALAGAGVHVIFEEKASGTNATAARSFKRCLLYWAAETRSSSLAWIG
jgi:resolvase-like protein